MDQEIQKALDSTKEKMNNSVLFLEKELLSFPVPRLIEKYFESIERRSNNSKLLRNFRQNILDFLFYF